jgi:hypothetical protein
LPPGLTLNTATGAITGTPSTATGSPFSFTVTATDTAGRLSPPQTLSIAIAASTTPTSVTLTSSANPITFGHTVTLTATVAPSTAAGKVTFYDGAIPLGTSAVSSGTATLSTTLLPSGGHSLRALFNGLPSYTTSTSTALSQTVNPVSATGFQTALNYLAGNGPPSGPPYAVLVGDFNGDGKADLALSGGVALGNGNGTFQTLIAYPNTAYTTVVAVGDFNGDGKLDLATATSGVMLGNGDGTFQPLIAYPASITFNGIVRAVSITVNGIADFNSDGKADLATSLGIILGNGDGTFQPPPTGPPVGTYPAPTFKLSRRHTRRF